MKDDQLPDIFSNDDEKELSLEEIIAADAADSEKEDKKLRKAEKKTSTKKIALISASGVLAAAVVAGVLVFNPFGGVFNFGNSENENVTSDKKVEKIEYLDIDPEDIASKDEDFATDEKRFPIKLEDWEKESFETQDGSEISQSVLKSELETSLFKNAGILPSEESGFTADPDKAELEDGSLNPLYSYWTAEVFTSEVGEYMKRLLNPTFGGWELYQYSSYPASQFFAIDSIQDMFTSEWRSSNADKPYAEYVPVYADWAGNDYGMGDVLLSSGSRWYGTVTSSSTNFVYDDELLQYKATLTAQVKFTAWNKDQSKLEKTGTLTLNLVPNVDIDGASNESGRRVLIESGSLKVDG